MDADLANDTFASNLAAAAGRHGMTTTDLARAASLPTSDVARILDGTHAPCARARQQLARAVGHTPDQLLHQEPPT